MIRAAEGYVHGEGGPVVVLPGRIASKLERIAGLDRIRITHRGTDAEFDAALLALHLVALAWRGTATGTEEAQTPEPGSQSSWLNTRQAADLTGMTDRGIRKAIAENRLAAQQVGRCYRIAREDVEHYRAARAA